MLRAQPGSRRSVPDKMTLLAHRLAWLVVLLVLVQQPTAVESKRTRGHFKLSGANTEHVLSSFAVGRQGGRLTVRLGADLAYANENNIKFRVYQDTVWKKFQKATLCSEKIKLATKTVDLTFAFKGDGPLAPKGGKWQAIRTVMIAEPNTDEAIKSTHYYYFVVDDCSLEVYLHDSQIPELFYEVNSWNYYGSSKNRRTSQLGANEGLLMEVHELTLFISILILAWLVFITFLRLVRKKNSNTIHVSLLWIMVAVALDLGSSICQLFHLEVYHYNGYGNYWLDCTSTHMEAVCDALLMLFLLSIAAGWTLPSDVIGINSDANSLQAVMSDMASPIGALLKKSRMGFVGLLFLGMHVGLAQWGRTYKDDFNTYHDFSHLPGHILIGFRVLLGILFLGTALRTRLSCRILPLKRFYAVIAVLGFVWFESLPAVTFVCNWMLPYHWRHPAVYFGSAILQSGSLVLLAWLVTSHYTAYHQYSHMSSNDGPSLTETLAATAASPDSKKEWKLIGKAKVRLD